MRYLLDTCVLSDPTQRRPNAGVRDWYARTPETNMYVSVLSVGEIRKGLVKLAGTPKAVRIGAWLDHELLLRFDRRLLGVDIDVCNLWGKICGELLQRGCPTPVMDSLIASVEAELAVPLGEAQSVFRAMAASGVYQELVVESEWSPERFERWLHGVLTTQLL